MKNKKIFTSVLFCLLLLIIIAAAGCSGSKEPSEPNASSATQPATQPPTEDEIQKQVDNMTLAEKAGQVITAGFSGTTTTQETESLINDLKVGGLILFSHNIESAKQLTELTNSLKAQSQSNNIPVLIGMDEEGGMVSRMPYDVQSMPGAYTLAQSENDTLCYSAGINIAQQLNAFGLNTGFSPVLDIWSNPDNTVIGERAFGTTAQQVCSYGIANLKGIKDGGAIAVAKHFPGHGDTDADSHYSLPVVSKTYDELKQSELLPFGKAIENNVPAIMAAHILCTQLDPDYPASLSEKIVQGILRDDMGFNGVVFTDDLTMGAIAESYSIENAAVLALNAGCDMLLVCFEYDNVTAVIDKIKEAVNDKTLSMERLDEAVYRILKMKSEYSVDSMEIPMPDINEMNQRTIEFFE